METVLGVSMIAEVGERIGGENNSKISGGCSFILGWFLGGFHLELN